jgi:hypothetical protein
VVVAGVGAFALQQNGRVHRLEQELVAAQSAVNPLADELESLRRERDELAARSKTGAGNGNVDAGDMPEIMRLRAQVARLTRTLAENKTVVKSGGAAPAAANGPGGVPGVDASNAAGLLDTVITARITQFRERLEQNPAQKIPELALATEEDWKDVAKNATWENPEDTAEAFKALRTRSKTRFAGALGPALRRFAANNNGYLPNDLSMVAPYFDPPIDPSILGRYGMVQTGMIQNVPAGQYIVREISPVDPRHDVQFSIGLSGYLQGSFQPPR